MSIRYITTGDEFEARGLLGEGRHQLSILKNDMTFQKLQQLQRIVRFDDGTVIKCLSCFGQDVIDVFVPMAGIEEKPEYIERVELNYYPTFEAYASADYDAEFLGIVLCKGGGFEPPYIFIDKRYLPNETLPEDYGDRPCEKLPKERFWEFSDGKQFEGQERDETTEYLDIVPSGIIDADLAQKTATAVDVSALGGFSGIITGVDRERIESVLCDYWKYCGKTKAVFSYTRTESLYKDFVFSYLLPDEANPGNWPNYTYEGRSLSGGHKPSTHILNLSDDLYYSTQGSGGSTFFGAEFYQALQNALKFVVDHWEEDPSINFDTVKALAESYVDYGTINDLVANYFTVDQKFCKRVGIVMGTGNCSYLNTDHSPWDFSASVLDDDHYALVYSLNSSEFGKNYSISHPVSDICISLWCNGYGLPGVCSIPTDTTVIYNCIEGPLNVAIDGEVFELFPQSSCPTAPRLQLYNVKYFRIGENISIGLFCVAKNYNYPFDYMYVYAKVIYNDQGKVKDKKLVVTEVDAQNHLIPGVKGRDNCDLYGHWNFRLIREDIRTVEEAA